MIKKGMKVGDNFTENNLVYKITKVNDDESYESMLIQVIESNSYEDIIENITNAEVEVTEEVKEEPKEEVKKPAPKKSTAKKSTSTKKKTTTKK